MQKEQENRQAKRSVEKTVKINLNLNDFTSFII